MVNSDPNPLSVSPQKSDAATIEEKDSTTNLLAQKGRHTDTKSSHSHKIALGGGGCCCSRPVPYVKWKDIHAVALRKFASSQQGVTYLDVLKLADDPTYTPKQAQKVLRNLKYKGRLHSCRRTIPQNYFISEVEAKSSAIEFSAKSRKSRHSEPTGVTARRQDKNVNVLSTVTVPTNVIADYYSTTTASLTAASSDITTTAYQQGNTLYDRLLLFKGAPICIHNIHLDFLVPTECYHLLNSPGVTIGHINKAKTLIRKIGKNRRVTYKLYPSGKVEVLISCSESAFQIVTDYDVTAMMGYMHQLQYNLSLQLSDVAATFQYVPPPETWRLTQADISKDVRVDPMSMHVEPNMQLEMVDRTLRLYVKLIDGESVLRLEEMRSFSERFTSVIESLREGVKS